MTLLAPPGMREVEPARIQGGIRTGVMVRRREPQIAVALHEPARGLQSAGTSDRPTRLEFSTASDVPRGPAD